MLNALDSSASLTHANHAQWMNERRVPDKLNGGPNDREWGA